MTKLIIVVMSLISLNLFAGPSDNLEDCGPQVLQRILALTKPYFAGQYDDIDIHAIITKDGAVIPTKKFMPLTDYVGTKIESDIHITTNMKVFYGHFMKTLGTPILPGVLHLDLMVMASATLAKKHSLGIFSQGEDVLELVNAHSVKFKKGIFPGDNVRTTVQLIEIDEYNGLLLFEGKIINTDDGEVHSTAKFSVGRSNKSLRNINHTLADYAREFVTEEYQYLLFLLQNLPTKETYLKKKEVLNFMPHREPFLFIDKVLQVIGTQRDFNTFNVISEFKVSNSSILRKADNGKKYFYEALQIEAIAQNAAFLLKEMMNIEVFPEFLLRSVNEFQSFEDIPRGTKTKIVSGIKSMKKMRSRDPKLSEPDQELINMIDKEGMSFSEVAIERNVRSKVIEEQYNNIKKLFKDNYKVELFGKMVLEDDTPASEAVIEAMVAVPRGAIDDSILNIDNK